LSKEFTLGQRAQSTLINYYEIKSINTFKNYLARSINFQLFNFYYC
jgi:hypothetical protein